MHVQPRKLEKLKKRLQQVLKQNTLDIHRGVIQQLSTELGIEPLDCASALLFISQPHLIQVQQNNDQAPQKPCIVAQPYRNVRYRLDVGTQHRIDQEQLLAVLVEESGVDRKRIARIEMRDHYTLVDLPDGMPADIFQLLSETTIGEQKLNIKRVKPNRRKFREKTT